MIISKIKWWKSKKNGQFYFHTVSRNGRTVQPSEGYKNKTVMLKTVKKIADQLLGSVAIIEVIDPDLKK